ncbi:hypothetical protein Taro_013952 [Colocasia esculenta]|uniref:Uncharacterized protein n=1 Tax=Colocasia esculenta TaxID=4460 RepID=A0A843UDJ6_COLES|nr:hypothetical protein [Colocasia esculenta]
MTCCCSVGVGGQGWPLTSWRPGSKEWLDDRRTRGVAELREETSRRGAIPVGARGGLGVNREIAGGSTVF